jgi:hypothetical protein
VGLISPSLAENVKFLGHLVSEKGLGMNPKKVQAIKSCTIPTTRRQLRGFLGIIGWYHRFVESFADIAKTLYELTKTQALTYLESMRTKFNALELEATRVVSQHPIHKM